MPMATCSDESRFFFRACTTTVRVCVCTPVRVCAGYARKQKIESILSYMATVDQSVVARVTYMCMHVYVRHLPEHVRMIRLGCIGCLRLRYRSSGSLPAGFCAKAPRPSGLKDDFAWISSCVGAPLFGRWKPRNAQKGASGLRKSLRLIFY